jgi:hypothetical protein
LKYTFLKLSDTNKGKKKEVRLKAYSVFTDKLEGNHIKLTTEMAQKSRDSMLLIGARVLVPSKRCVEVEETGCNRHSQE